MKLDNCVLGIEFGSTRIKAVLLDQDRKVAVTGSHTWENRLVDGIWTYDIDEIHRGMQCCYADLRVNFENKYNQKLTHVGAIGISGMMHGYLPFDSNMRLITRFRTWRNTITEKAAEELSENFGFNIPQRWSIAHLYQDILDKKPYLNDIDFLTTLSGYIHWLLTGEKAMGIGEASGMFPIDSDINNYCKDYVDKFNTLAATHNFSRKIEDILPKVLCAGQLAGHLTEQGAKLLDPTGNLKAGIPFAAPEGDAGTGMTATNSVKTYTGNVSAGTSIFAMVVVDHMPNMYKEIDMVTTPSGKPVAMVHCNNCTSDLNGWVGLFREFADAIGSDIKTDKIYEMLFKKALEADTDCGGLMSYNYLSGEGITDLNEGVPVFMRMPDGNMNLANFMRTHLFSCIATLKIGLDLLIKKENIRIDKIYGHGGLFKTEAVGQRFMSAAVSAPVSVLETAGEGGPYGMALLAAYLLDRQGETLEEYLENKIFSEYDVNTAMAQESDIASFNNFMEKYIKGFAVEKTAIEAFLA